METIDGILVCGAGPVGLVAALRLAREGQPVIVIDSGSAIVDSPRAAVYHSPVVERLDEMGLLDDLKTIGVLKHSYHYWTRDHALLGTFGMSAFRPADTPHPYNLHLGQPALAATILRHLLRLPSAQVRWNHALVGLEQDDSGVTATLDTPMGRQQVRARWFIGADGGRSTTRRLLNLSFEGTTWPEWFVATNVMFDFEAHGFGQSNVVIDPDHWAIIPKIDQTGLWRCTYRENPGLSAEEVIRRVPDRLALFAPGLGDCKPVAVSPYRVHDRCVDRFRIGRILLAGDAAHLVNPIGGLGLTCGLLDATALTDALLAVIHGQRGTEVLDHYAGERRRVFLQVVSPTAQENRRRCSERDPQRHRADVDRLQRLTRDTMAAREALLNVFRIVGRHPLT